MNSIDYILIAFLLMLFAADWGFAFIIFFLFLFVIFAFPLFRKKLRLILAIFLALIVSFLLYNYRNPHIKEEDFPEGKFQTQIIWTASLISSGEKLGICKILQGPFKGKRFLALDHLAGPKGSIEKVTLSFQPFDRSSYPGQFNEEKVRESRGLSGKVKIYRHQLLKDPDLFTGLQNKLLKKLERQFALFPASSRAFLQKIFLASVEEEIEIKGIMEKLGLLHLLAASGIHVSLIFSFFLFLLPRMGLGRKKSDFVIFSFLFFYAKLLDFPPSICRAGLFLFFRELSFLFQRKMSFMRIFELSLFILLVFRPYQVSSYALHLSYACTLGIAAANQIQKKNPFYMLFFKNIRISLWISLMTLPFIALMGGEWNPLVLIANLFAIPFFSLMFFVAILAYFFSFLFPSFHFLIFVFEIFYQTFEKLLKGLSIFQLPAIRLVSFKKSFALYLFLLIFFYFWRAGILHSWKRSINMFSALKRKEFDQSFFLFSKFLIFFTSILFLIFFLPIEDPLFYGLDVGQGDAFLLQYCGKNILFDTGGRFDFVHQKSRDGEDFTHLLDDMGIKKLDAVFLSHKDFDHIGNLKSLTERIPVREIFLSPDHKGKLDSEFFKYLALEPVEKDKIEIQRVEERESFLLRPGMGQRNPLIIQVLNPGQFDAEDRNNHSMVLLLDYGPRILLTGDLEEDQNWEKNWPKKISLLKIAHHGSAKGTSSKFLEYVKPDRALISSARNNGYGHPHKDTLERLKKLSIPYDCTSNKGTLVYQKHPFQAEKLICIRKKDRDRKRIFSIILSQLVFAYWLSKSEQIKRSG